MLTELDELGKRHQLTPDLVIMGSRSAPWEETDAVHDEDPFTQTEAGGNYGFH